MKKLFEFQNISNNLAHNNNAAIVIFRIKREIGYKSLILNVPFIRIIKFSKLLLKDVTYRISFYFSHLHNEKFMMSKIYTAID